MGMGAREVRYGLMWPYMIAYLLITLLIPPTYSFTVYVYFHASAGVSGVVPEGHMGAWEWVLERLWPYVVIHDCILGL
jgi:hypothetical protein